MTFHDLHLTLWASFFSPCLSKNNLCQRSPQHNWTNLIKFEESENHQAVNVRNSQKHFFLVCKYSIKLMIFFALAYKKWSINKIKALY